MKEPPLAQQADSILKVRVRDNRKGIVGWLRGHGSNADLLVQSQAWYQFHHLAMVWTGGLEPPTPGSRSRCAPVASRPGVKLGNMAGRGGGHVPRLRLVGTDGRIRTDTGGGLSAVPLPVGLRQRERGPCGGRTRDLLLAGELRCQLRHRPTVVAGAGIEPATRGVWALADLQIPRIDWGDRPDSNRLPPGPRPGVSSTSTSATVDEEGVEPPASSVCGRRSAVDLLVGG